MPDPAWSELQTTDQAAFAADRNSVVPVWRASRDARAVSFDGFSATFSPPTNRIFGQINTAVRFAAGDLLFNVLPHNICFHFSQKTRKFTFVFEADWGPGSLLWSCCPDAHGNIFATMSGIRTPPPLTDAEFGNWGGVFVVTPRKHAMRTLAERGLVVDPYSIQILDDGRLLVCDFGGFGGSGRVYIVDPLCGHVEVVAEGANLIDPTSAFQDSEGKIWVANGDQVRQDGEVIGIDPASGDTRVLYPRDGDMSGALLGVLPTEDPNFLIATKNEWANRTRSCVLMINKTDGTAIKILSASEDEPKFFSTKGCVIGDNFWVAECINRELICFSLSDGKIVDKFDLAPIMGGYCGMRNSFDAISAIYAVPEEKGGNSK